MDLTFDVLLFLHLTALVVGMASNVVMPLLGPQMAKASPEARGGFAAVAKQLRLYGSVALAVLLVTGFAMVWLRYGGVAGLNEWFWAKMALIALLIVLMGVAGFLGPRLNPRIFGLVTRVVLLGIVFSAVMAFA